MSETLNGLRLVGAPAAVDFDHSSCPAELTALIRCWGHGRLGGLLQTTAPDEGLADLVASVLGEAGRAFPIAWIEFGYLLWSDGEYRWLNMDEGVATPIGHSFAQLVEFLTSGIDAVEPPGSDGRWGAKATFEVEQPEADEAVLTALTARDYGRAQATFERALRDGVDYYVCTSLLDALACDPDPTRLRSAETLAFVEGVHALYLECAPHSSEYDSVLLPLLPDASFRVAAESDSWRVFSDVDRGAVRLLRLAGSATTVRLAIARGEALESVVEIEVRPTAEARDHTVGLPSVQGATLSIVEG